MLCGQIGYLLGVGYWGPSCLPLDIQEATWLVKLLGRVLSTAELIGYRAKALAKHRQHVIEMRQRIDQKKRVTCCL